MVTSLCLGQREYLYLEPETLADPARNVRGGIPLLFPICGPLEGGVWAHEGQEFRMPQHGLARQAEWEILEQGPDWVELGFPFDEKTLKQYPFAFLLKVHYQVEHRTLTIRQTYANRGPQEMPFQTGLHPYFRVQSPLSWDLPVQSYRDNERPDQPAQPWSGTIPEDRPVLDWELGGLTALQAGLQDIRLHYDQHYPYLVVWHLADKPFWCLEPWSGPRFGLQRRQNVLTCAPGQQLETTVKIEV
jgi:galactose mutarotase-like enzyme